MPFAPPMTFVRAVHMPDVRMQVPSMRMREFDVPASSKITEEQPANENEEAVEEKPNQSQDGDALSRCDDASSTTVDGDVADVVAVTNDSNANITDLE